MVYNKIDLLDDPQPCIERDDDGMPVAIWLSALSGQGLDFFPVLFEMVPYEQMNMLAAYQGFPVRYRHWRWGMEYERISKSYSYGLSIIYEMVINNDPCYAYLLDLF